MTTQFPRIIQGGMGAAVSNYTLARAVSSHGGLGVVSGTGIDQILARRLQQADSQADMLRALEAFPCQETANEIIEKYYVEGGKAPDDRYKTPAMYTVDPSKSLVRLTVAAGFVEVWLAKEGQNNPVGLNLLEKIPLPNPAVLYGAMLAGVEYVLMGAGIPWQIPGILDNFAENKPATMQLALEDDPDRVGTSITLDPSEILTIQPKLKRPRFLAIVSSDTLAMALTKRATGHIDGFVVEAHVAGGHNAPPRGRTNLNERGEPIYGPRDEAKLERFASMDRPFWLAGAWGFPGALQEAQKQGATGIQIGSAFAFCKQSGLEETLRVEVLKRIADGSVDVFTDPVASPTGFPFKVIGLEGTMYDDELYNQRKRVCDIGYLRHLYRKEDGSVGYRCPSDVVKNYVRDGGSEEETVGRKCLCNGLLANIGLGQTRKGESELPLLTGGDELVKLKETFPDNLLNYTAEDVLEMLKSEQKGKKAEEVAADVMD